MDRKHYVIIFLAFMLLGYSFFLLRLNLESKLILTGVAALNFVLNISKTIYLSKIILGATLFAFTCIGVYQFVMEYFQYVDFKRVLEFLSKNNDSIPNPGLVDASSMFGIVNGIWIASVFLYLYFKYCSSKMKKTEFQISLLILAASLILCCFQGAEL